MMEQASEEEGLMDGKGMAQHNIWELHTSHLAVINGSVKEFQRILSEVTLTTSTTGQQQRKGDPRGARLHQGFITAREGAVAVPHLNFTNGANGT